MRTTAERLRVWIVVLGSLLVLALVGFYGYARWQRRQFIKDLPGKLGISIQQSGNTYTFSSSNKDHVQYTIHAAKFVQFKGGGRVALHDVSITLNGPKGSGHSDRIYGSDFEYDPQAGIATAQGEVQIDLEAPGPSPGAGKDAAGDADTAQAEKSTIHVKTSGVTFNQNTGLASTDKYLEFHFAKAAGNAMGASYDSKVGELVLNSAVQLTSSTNGEPLVVRASNAQVLRDTRQAFLLHPTTDFRNETSSADEAVVYFRPDGSADAIDARGHLHIASDSGARVEAGQGHVDLDTSSQPRQSQLSGGVLFTSQDSIHHMHGNSQSAILTFSENATLKHVRLRETVSFVDEQDAVPGDPRGDTTRQVEASNLDVDFAPGPDGKPAASKLLAQGGSSLLIRSIPLNSPAQSTTISGDLLLATLVNGNAIASLHGSGNTKILESNQNGTTSSSTGDTLDVTFSDPPLHGSAAGPAARHAAKVRLKAAPSKPAGGGAALLSSAGTQVETALQIGHVTLAQTPARDQTAATPLQATAARAEYHAADQVLHLTGDPRLNNGQLDVSAASIEFHRYSGDANASGSVKATYLQKSEVHPVTLGSQGPVHIIADGASLSHATGDATFRGQARMWQGSNAVSAPVIELSRTKQTLTAHGNSAEKAGPALVNATFATAAGQNRQPGVSSIRSQSLFYSDAERKADFRGAVVAQDANGTVHADQAEAILLPAKAGAGKTAPATAGGQSPLDTLIASGHVLLTQPGRKAEGAKLVYSQSDGVYVLTGTPAAPPRLTDQAHGTVTGSSLTFNSRDDSVSVSGGQQSSVTQTRAPK